MNELFREHLEAPRHRPRYGTVEIDITPIFGNTEDTPQIWNRDRLNFWRPDPGPYPTPITITCDSCGGNTKVADSSTMRTWSANHTCIMKDDLRAWGKAGPGPQTIVINPDCLEEKHRACSGAGWNQTQDTPADCPCDCHTEPAPEPAPHWSDDLSWRMSQPVTLPRGRRHYLPPALAAQTARASRYDAMKALDPARLTQAAFMANYTALSIEEAWEQIGRITEKPRTEWPWLAGPPTPPQQPTTQELRQAALAAKAERGSGPGAGPSWRGRTRNIRYQPK